MVARHIVPIVEKSLELFPAVLLNGARQVGKSTLAKQLVKEKKVDRYISLDDIIALEAATKDPQSFISQFPSSVVIDEVQRVPSLILAAKQAIDTKKILGKFLFTGSANILSYPNVRDSLAGRMHIISLEGLSLNEVMQRKKSSFLDMLLRTKDVDLVAQQLSSEIRSGPVLTQQSLNELLSFGAFPDVILKKDSTYRTMWISSYITAYVERDVRDLSKFVDIVSFAKLLKIVGIRTSNLLNNKNLSISVGLDQRTVARYLELLEMSFQINLLRPWSSNLGKRYVKTPKIFMNDVGLASYFVGVNDINSIEEHNDYGHLVETWVFSELRKALVYHPDADIFFYRDHSGLEADFLIIQGERVIGIECKASSSITMKDCKNLKVVGEEFKDNFLGVILYRGSEVIKLDKNIIAVPFEGLLCE